MSCAKNCGLDDEGAGAVGTILVEDESIAMETEDDIITGFGTGFEDSIVSIGVSSMGAGVGTFGAAAGAGEGEDETSSPL